MHSNNGGRTFEDELFLSNFDKKETAIALLKVALPEVLHPFIDDYGLDINKWQSHIQDIDGRSKKTINKFLNLYNNRIDKDKVSDEWYQRLFLQNCFYIMQAITKEILHWQYYPTSLTRI